MKVSIIGCSGSMSGPDSAASCYLVQAHDGCRTWSIALDMGPGSFGALWRVIEPAELDGVVFSHLHADHCADIISLYVYRRWHPNGPMLDLPLVGPPGVLQRVVDIDGPGAEPDMGGTFKEMVLHDRKALHIGPFIVEPFAANHTVAAFGLRVSGPGEGGTVTTVAYTGDTDTCDSITHMSSGVDLLLCEAGFTEAEKAPRGIHLTGKRAGELALESSPKKMVLTHIQPWTNPQVLLDEARAVWPGPIEVATSGASWLI